MRQTRYVHMAIFALLVAAFIATRFWRLTDSCLWFDEIFSIHAAEHAWNSILSFVALDLVHPPFFYVLLKLWIGIGGESLLWVRTLPVLFSILSLFPLISLLRELKRSKATQLICLLLLTVNGSLLKYSQEVRMYSLLMCLSLFSMWLFARYFVKGKSFIPLIIVNILLVYTHYFGWFVLLSEVAAILIFQRIKWRRIVVMFTITFVSFVPWMIAVFQASRQSEGLNQNIGQTLRPGMFDLVKLKLNLIEPFYFAATTVDPISNYDISIPLLLIFTVAAILYAANWKVRPDDDRQPVYLVFVFAVFPVIAAFISSWLLPYSIWGTRHLIFIFAPVSTLLAVALTSIPNVKAKTAAITLTVLFSGYAFVGYAAQREPLRVWCAWGKLAAENMQGSAISNGPQRLYVFEDLVAYHLWFNLRHKAQYEVDVVRGIDGLEEDTGFFLPRGFDGVKTIGIDQITDGRFWIAFREPNRPDLADGRSHEPLVSLQNRGFVPIEAHKIEVGSEIAYLVLMER